VALIELGAPDRNVAGVRTWRRAVTLAAADDEIAVVIPRGSGALIAAAIDAGAETVLPVIGTSESPTGIDLLYTETDPAANWRLATILRIAARTTNGNPSRLVIRPDLQGAPTLPAVVVVELETAERGALEDIANAYTDEAIGAGAAAQIAERYAVQKDLVDSTAHAAARVFSTIALAIAAGEAAGHDEIVIEPSPLYWLSGVRHAWDLSSGFAADSGMSVVVHNPDPFCAITLTGTAPAADDDGPNPYPQIVFHGGDVRVSSAINVGANRQFSMRSVNPFDGNAFAFTLSNADLFFDNSRIEAPRFTTPGGGVYFAAVLNHCTLFNFPGSFAGFSNLTALIWSACAVTTGTGTTPLAEKEVGLTADFILDGCSIDVAKTTAGARTLFDVGTGGTLTLNNVDVKATTSGGGTIALYNAGAIVLEATGFLWTNGVLSDLYGNPIGGGGTDELAYTLTDLETVGSAPTAWGAVDGGLTYTILTGPAAGYVEYAAPSALGAYYLAEAGAGSVEISGVFDDGGPGVEVNVANRMSLIHDGACWRIVDAAGTYNGTEGFAGPPSAAARVVIAGPSGSRVASFEVSTDHGGSWTVVGTRTDAWAYKIVFVRTGGKVLSVGETIT
jgi:hypothetical protein